MTWRKRTIMELAREAGWDAHHAKFDTRFETFAALVREEAIAEANARANASWTLMCEKMVAIEREACAKLCEPQEEHDDPLTAWKIAAAIRARNNT